MDQIVGAEKSTESSFIFSESDSLGKPTLPAESFVIPPVPVPRRLAQWDTRIESLAGLEARGIARMPSEERHKASVLNYAQMAILWLSINVTANNLVVGMLGPLVFDLGFFDSAMMATFGCLLGSMETAYMSIWGAAQSGNRTMVCYSPLNQDLSISRAVRFRLR